MGVSICTKKTIVADDYNELIIRHSSNKRFYVEARPDTKKHISNKLEMDLLDSIIGLSDEVVLMRFINHFLEGVTLNRLALDEPVKNQIGNYDKFESLVQNKSLALQIASSDLSQKIKNKLREKFYSDRQKFLVENKDITFYSICYSDNECSYYKSKKDKIYMKLYMKNPNKYETEMEFLRNFLKEKLEVRDSIALMYDETIRYDEYNAEVCIGRYIECEDLLITISSEFVSYVSEIIDEHNKKVKKEKIKQLKMEGF